MMRACSNCIQQLTRAGVHVCLQDRARLASEVERLKDENERLWARAQESDSRAEDVELLLITAHASSSSGDADGDGTVAQRPRTESRPERESVEEQAAVRKEWKERYDLQRIGLLTRARLRRQKMAILHRLNYTVARLGQGKPSRGQQRKPRCPRVGSSENPAARAWVPGFPEPTPVGSGISGTHACGFRDFRNPHSPPYVGSGNPRVFRVSFSEVCWQTVLGFWCSRSFSRRRG